MSSGVDLECCFCLYVFVFNILCALIASLGASQVVLMVKNRLANAGDARDVGLISGSGRSPGIGNGNLLQSSCLENPMERGAWWASAHRVAESQT